MPLLLFGVCMKDYSSSEVLKELKQALDRSIIALMRDKRTVFFSIAATNLRHLISPTMSGKTQNGTTITVNIPTACTNYKVCVYNPNFFDSLNKAEKVFLVAHEVGHVLFKHDLRCGGRNRAVWAFAADYELNPMLMRMGLQMPDGGLYDRQYDGMSAEQIYEILITQYDQPPPDEDDPHFLPSPDNEVDRAKQEYEIDNIILKSTIAAEQAGFCDFEDFPDAIKGLIHSVRKPKLNPLRVLGNYINQSFGFQCYNYAKQHRKSTATHYMPARSKKSVKNLMFFIDSSGSVSEEHFSTYVKAIELSHKRLKPKKATLVVFDTSIREEYDVTKLSNLKRIEMTGRGGTRIAPVIERIQQDKPDLALVFTDGYFRFPSDVRLKHTVWYINDHDNFKMPKQLGVTINYTI